MREKQKKIMQWSSLALILLTGIIVWRVNYEIDFMMDDEWYSTLLYADTPILSLIHISLSSGNGYVHADRMWQQACRQ